MPLKDKAARKAYNEAYYVVRTGHKQGEPKIRFCTVCGVEMICSRHSSRLFCNTCRLVHNREKQKKYYISCAAARTRASLKQKQKLRDDPQLRLWVRARLRARDEGYDFDISKEDIVIPTHCPILSQDFEYKTSYTMSLDRIDSTKGYTKDNIQVISWKANTMKNNATVEELRRFASWVNRTYPDPAQEYE